MQPKHKLTREQKIKALQAIKEGKATLDILKPAKTYIFFQVSSDPVYYECEGKYYSEAEHAARVKEIEKSASDFITWNEELTPPRVINLIRQEGYTTEQWGPNPDYINQLIKNKI